MKVLHLNYAQGDGAGNAVVRIHHALIQQGIESRFIYLRPHDSLVSPFAQWEKKTNGAQNLLVAKVVGGDPVAGYPAINLFPTKVLKTINTSDADIVHLHWINGEMMSIAQIAKINKPIVWTFHSMWPFLGMHHWDNQRTEDRGQNSAVEVKDSWQKFLDKWTYKRKEVHWQDLKCQVVCPSTWMADCARRSELFGNHSISVIPNCLDLEIFRPLGNRLELRKQFGLPLYKRVILFGATQPGSKRKGGDLIASIFQGLENKSEYTLAVFGTADRNVYTSIESEYGLETHELGFIHDEETMARIYNSADIMCVPSRMDNLPSTCVEPLACGVPVVAFNVGGIPDIVEHQVTGYLAEPFDPDDFRNGIAWALDGRRATESMSACRERAERLFDPKVVAKQYFQVYENMVTSV
ncbi:glycosyltransferase [Pontiellaceae bacterium B12219]|nr:glycosyltransferase [Pontiellaceae bacterium B12219]